MIIKGTFKKKTEQLKKFHYPWRWWKKKKKKKKKKSLKNTRKKKKSYAW